MSVPSAAELQAAVQYGQQLAVETFQFAAARVPAYRDVLSRAGVDPASIKTIQDFRSRVPFLDKEHTFGRYPFEELCVDGSLAGVGTVMASSGHSGIYSLGAINRASIELTTEAVDGRLRDLIAAHERPTLIINCLAMGVRVSSKLAVVAETSVRADSVLALIKTLASKFDQTVLVGEPTFLKYVIETGVADGIQWPSLRVHVVTGGESVAENWRTYIGRLLGHDPAKPENGQIVITMGVSELGGVLIFSESADTRRLRQAAHRDPMVRAALFGPEARVCPTLFMFHPPRTFVEILPATPGEEPNDLVLTILGVDQKVPLPRYRTGDRAQSINRAALAQVMGLPADRAQAAALLPIVAISGRNRCVRVGEQTVFPEAVKEALYADPEVAVDLLGFFAMKETLGRLELTVHLKPGLADLTERKKISLEAALNQYVAVPTHLQTQTAEALAPGFAIDFEKKFRYL